MRIVVTFGSTNTQTILSSVQEFRTWVGNNPHAGVRRVDADRGSYILNEGAFTVEKLLSIASDIDRKVGNPHIVDDKFQSDKFPSAPRGFLPLSLADPMAQDLIAEYARRRRSEDAQFSDAIEHCLKVEGYDGSD